MQIFHFNEFPTTAFEKYDNYMFKNAPWWAYTKNKKMCLRKYNSLAIVLKPASYSAIFFYNFLENTWIFFTSSYSYK